MALCRCGGKAAQKCSVCGHELNSTVGLKRECQHHPGAPPATIHCADCMRPLCFWHFVFNSIGLGKHEQRCFPSCRHAFDVKTEWRADQAAVSR